MSSVARICEKVGQCDGFVIRTSMTWQVKRKAVLRTYQSVIDNYKGRDYTGHDYIGQTCSGRNCTGHNHTRHNYAGRNCTGHNCR